MNPTFIPMQSTRHLLCAPPASWREWRAHIDDINAAFRDRPDVKSRLETEWDASAKAAYARVRELADAAAARVR